MNLWNICFATKIIFVLKALSLAEATKKIGHTYFKKSILTSLLKKENCPSNPKSKQQSTDRPFAQGHWPLVMLIVVLVVHSIVRKILS